MRKFIFGHSRKQINLSTLRCDILGSHIGWGTIWNHENEFTKISDIHKFEVVTTVFKKLNYKIEFLLYVHLRIPTHQNQIYKLTLTQNKMTKYLKQQ
jgi:hypothetical protein